jgi:hypothetical protein
MKHISLGGLDVARIGLGAMPMSALYTGAGSDDDGAVRARPDLRRHRHAGRQHRRPRGRPLAGHQRELPAADSVPFRELNLDIPADRRHG